MYLQSGESRSPHFSQVRAYFYPIDFPWLTGIAGIKGRKLRILHKVFLALLLSTASALALMALLVQWNLGRGFLDYVLEEDATGEDIYDAFGELNGPSPPPAFPLPAAAWLFASALFGLFATTRRR